MIKYIKQGDIYAPIISCDYCGEPIDNGQGNVHYIVTETEDMRELYFSHKTCGPTMDRYLYVQDRNRTVFTEELDRFLFYLVNNSKVDLGEAKKDVKFWKDHTGFTP